MEIVLCEPTEIKQEAKISPEVNPNDSILELVEEVSEKRESEESKRAELEQIEIAPGVEEVPDRQAAEDLEQPLSLKKNVE